MWMAASLVKWFPLQEIREELEKLFGKYHQLT
jgi:hypothetical protein